MLTTATSTDEARRQAHIAVWPVGSFEQHGDHLPLTTDTIVASVIAERMAHAYDLFLLPPLTLSCSHEHAGFAGTVSISAVTLAAVVDDVRESLEQAGINRLMLVNGHGGNYVLANITQQANINGPRMTLFPGRDDWDSARRHAGIKTTGHDDMHGGELETSILLRTHPDLVRPTYADADHQAADRRHLLVAGMSEYTSSGIIGYPSLATAEKGEAVLERLTIEAADHLKILDR